MAHQGTSSSSQGQSSNPSTPVKFESARVNFPPELEDDQQAAVLYSPFREKSVNPRSWSRKMTFWQDVLLNVALEKNMATFDLKTLPLLFERKGLAPKCLDTVIEDLKRSGKIKSLDDYNKQDSWLSWGFNSLVKQPLTWSVSQLLGSPQKGSDVYVWPQVVQKLSENVLDLYHSQMKHEVTDCVTSLDDLRSQCLHLIPQQRDFNIVISWMEKIGHIRLRELEDGQRILKVCKKGETKAEPLTDTDVHIFRINETERKLEEEIELLSTRIDGYTEEAKQYVRQKKRTRALHSLRKKKSTQQVLDRKSGSVLKLQDIIMKIEDSRTNEMVIKACETGVAALKSLNAETNLDKVETVMDQVQEVLEDQEEISQVMGVPGLSGDDDELEEELQELLSSDRATAPGDVSLDDVLTQQLSALTVDDLGLPNVPITSPSRTTGGVKQNPVSQPEMLPS